jgi:membrane protein
MSIEADPSATGRESPADDGKKPGLVDPPPLLSRSGLRWVAAETVRGVWRDDCLGLSAEIAYFGLFSLFPFLLFLRSLIPYTPWAERLVAAGQEALAGLVNPSSELYGIVAENVIVPVRTASQTLLSIGALLTLWSASSVFGVLIKALNRAYGLQETRSWYRRRAMAVMLTLVMLLLVPSGFALLLVGPFLGRLIGRYVGGAQGFEAAWTFVRWPLVFAFLAGALALVYYFAPNTRQKWHWLTPGSLVAVAAVVVESQGLSWAMSTRLFRPQWLTYGAIGAAIIIVFWLYLIGLSVLVGAEVNAAVERRRGHLPRR